ncbi:hypothetical protein F442_21434, partial [Phytophthora nicotianae P10297]
GTFTARLSSSMRCSLTNLRVCVPFNMFSFSDQTQHRRDLELRCTLSARCTTKPKTIDTCDAKRCRLLLSHGVCRFLRVDRSLVLTDFNGGNPIPSFPNRHINQAWSTSVLGNSNVSGKVCSFPSLGQK